VTDGDRAIYVYGVTSGSNETEIDVAGVGPREAPIRRIREAGVAAIVSDVPRGPLAAARDLRAHWRVLDKVASVETVLPVRFATVMESEDAVRREFLAPNADRLRTLLAELDGKVQLTVKGFYDEERLLREIVSESPEVARLRERTRTVSEAAGYYDRIRLGELVAAELERRRVQDAELFLSRLGPKAVAAKTEEPATKDGAVHAAFLVERNRIDEFTRAVQRLTDELGERIRIRYVGPLPPYSFAEEETAGAPAWA
jgi:Gas vesicle synthesis protein GvpL/GvpF